MYTREEFEEMRIRAAADMAADEQLRRDALDVLVRADNHSWIHQTTWMGQPILQLPQDMFALQEIIFATRPDYIVEIGVAWGGSLLFYATLMEVLGGKGIIGVDIYMPDDMRARIGSFGRLSEKITWINRSSTEEETVAKVKSIVGDSRRVLVALDSNHTHDHVLQELRLYSPLVGKDCYLVCGDTIIEYLPEQVHGPRPWGHGNNPHTAVREFLGESGRFEVDTALENKLLFTCMPGGYLRCIKDP